MLDSDKITALLIKDSKAVSTAVKWWGDFLRGSKTTHFRNGDDGLNGIVLGLTSSSKRTSMGHIDDAIVCKFESILGQYLINEGVIIDQLSVDYTPDTILTEALTMAGVKVDSAILPWKTEMDFMVNDGKLTITTSYGYRSNDVVIYKQY